MTGTPWQGDVVGLVEAFRAGERSPTEELEATLAAVEASDLNAVCHIDPDAARRGAASADVSLPYGGVPLAVKELLAVGGWPAAEGSIPLKDEIFTHDDISVERLKGAGAVAAVQTTSSEFGATNQTTTKLHGATRNPWNLERTPGGSSGGSAAGVAGGLFTLATASDGGGSIRIPAGFCGLIGLKSTFGRIPRGPGAILGNATSVEGTVSRSVRDAARYLDVTNGFDGRDPRSLPRVEGYEAGLGTHAGEVSSLRVAIVPDLSCAVVGPETEELVIEAAEELLAAAGMQRVDLDLRLPSIMGVWGATGGVGIRKSLGERWPDCAPDLGGVERYGQFAADKGFTIDAMARAETRRAEFNNAMAAMFDEVDIVLAATNPSTAFAAEGRIPHVFEGRESKAGNNGALTAPANIFGNPAIALPAGLASDGLPVSLQVLGPHFREDLLLEIAQIWERVHPVELAI
ncbi:MAG: amidase [Acidimicrobiales bacterium]|nr:amidase [Acidimicrobiales bacterium]